MDIAAVGQHLGLVDEFESAPAGGGVVASGTGECDE